jgi:N-acetylmuramoyl-L-alanine amidase
MPDELEAIDEIVRAESNVEFNEAVLNKEPMKIDTVVLVDKEKVKENTYVKGNTNEVGSAIKEKELNSSPLTQEIRKEETLNLNLPKTVDKANVTPSVQTNNETESNATPPITPQSTNTVKDKTTEQKGNFLYHTVKKDDTLFRISVNYNVTLDDLWKLNKLSSNIVKVGVVLKIRSL